MTGFSFAVLIRAVVRADVDSIERRHLFHIRNTRCCAGDDIGAARRPRSVKQ